MHAVKIAIEAAGELAESEQQTAAARASSCGAALIFARSTIERRGPKARC